MLQSTCSKRAECHAGLCQNRTGEVAFFSDSELMAKRYANLVTESGLIGVYLDSASAVEQWLKMCDESGPGMHRCLMVLSVNDLAPADIGSVMSAKHGDVEIWLLSNRSLVKELNRDVNFSSLGRMGSSRWYYCASELKSTVQRIIEGIRG